METELNQNQARLIVTLNGETGDFPDPIQFGPTEGQSWEDWERDVKRWASEAISNGDIAGIPAEENADFTDFVIDKVPPNDVCTHARVLLRPKTPFGTGPRFQELLNKIVNRAGPVAENLSASEWNELADLAAKHLSDDLENNLPNYDRYKYSILEICSILHGQISGTESNNYTEQELEERYKWLLFRFKDWESSKNPSNEKYDNLVRSLVRATIIETKKS